MTKKELIKRMEDFIDGVKRKDDKGFSYGGKIVIYEDTDEGFYVEAANIEMSLKVEALLLNDMEEKHFNALMMEVYNKKLNKGEKNEED